METFLQDFRYGLRLLRKNPGFASVAVLTVALGIGANTLIFSAVEGVLLRPLPFRDPDRLMMVWETHPYEHFLQVATGDYFDLRDQNTSFENLAAYSYKGESNFALTEGDQPEQVQGTVVSQNFLSTLGVSPAIGRGFAKGEDEPGKDHVVLLSDALWRRRFNADTSVIGRSITLEKESYTVIGVMSAESRLPVWADVWLPLSRLGAAYYSNPRKFHPLEVVGRLKPGVTPKQAQAEVANISARLEKAFPATNKDIGSALVPLSEQTFGSARPALLLLLAIVGFVLLIACANVANLMLARTMARQKELAMRTALGANSWRLFRQSLTESMVIATVGGIFGLLFATVSVPVLRAWVGNRLPRTENIAIDLKVLGFTLLVTLCAGLIFGLLPAIQAWSPNLYNVIKDSDSNRSSPYRRLARGLLVVGEVALALLVLISSGLLIRSFQQLLNVDPGFRADHVLTAKLNLPAAQYGSSGQINGFYQRLLADVKAMPQVQDAAVVNNFPLNNELDARSRFAIEGTQPEPGKFPVTQIRVISTDYFKTMKIPLLMGRFFQDADFPDNAPTGLLINQAFRKRFFAGENPLGKNVLLDVLSPKPTPYAVWGVVGDVKDMHLETEAEPEIYFPGFGNKMTVIIRTNADPVVLAGDLRRVVSGIDKNQPVAEVRTLEQVLDTSIAKQKVSALLLGLFALTALILASVGIYGVVAYTVTQRTREIGIRIALGARRADVLQMIVHQGMSLVLVGLMVGIVGSLLSARLISTLLFKVASTDIGTFSAAPLFFIVVALLACYIPARRATRVDPIVALRYE